MIDKTADAADLRWLLSAALGAQAPADFDAEYARLKQGRTYSRDVKTGALKRRHGAYPYWLIVPASYDPAKTYQVRFQLHGGAMISGAAWNV